MRIDLDDIRRNYASLPDGALLALNRAELSDVARPLYDEELAKRGLRPGQKVQEFDEGDEESFEDEEDLQELEVDEGATEDWLEEAACACAFATRSARADHPDAVKARVILRDAGIPSHVSVTQEERPKVDDTKPVYALRLMVPAGLELCATSVLDQHLFNDELEHGWRANLEALTDDELRDLDPDVLCAGLLDRVARLKKAYADEMGHRKLKARR